MTDNPARAFHYPTHRKVQATVLGDTEVEDYLDAGETLGYLPMFALMLTVGLRQRELLALKWSDLDEQTDVLTVWSRAQCGEGQVERLWRRHMTNSPERRDDRPVPAGA